MTNNSGYELESTEYMPFGSQRNHSGTNTSDYRFTDQELDAENGLYNYDARLYDPVIGRFISPDTIVQAPYNPQSLNRYTYCLNNPLIYTDPSGHVIWFMAFGKLLCGGVMMGTQKEPEKEIFRREYAPDGSITYHYNIPGGKSGSYTEAERITVVEEGLKDPNVIKGLKRAKELYGVTEASGCVIIKDGVPYPTALFAPDTAFNCIQYMETMDHEIDHINTNPLASKYPEKTGFQLDGGPYPQEEIDMCYNSIFRFEFLKSMAVDQKVGAFRNTIINMIDRKINQLEITIERLEKEK